MLIDELIERAFCDGYEYALEQKEFNNRAQKILRRKFDFQRGIKSISNAPKSVRKEIIQKPNEIIERGRFYNRFSGFTGDPSQPINIHHKINDRAIERGIHPNGHNF